MPIKDYPFTTVASGQSVPMLWIRIINPHKNLAFETLAIIDTGADDCAFPAQVAFQLGHDLESVPPKEIRTASGKTYAYPHTSRIDILEMMPDGTRGTRVLYTVLDTTIDFTKRCPAFILGTKKFLSKFVLTIDYPRRIFSLRLPTTTKGKKKKKR